MPKRLTADVWERLFEEAKRDGPVAIIRRLRAYAIEVKTLRTALAQRDETLRAWGAVVQCDVLNVKSWELYNGKTRAHWRSDAVRGTRAILAGRKEER